MAATVRIAASTAATSSGQSTGKGVSRGTSASLIRIAEITAQSFQSVATVRLGDINCQTQTVSTAIVRLGDIAAFSVQTEWVWNGAQWVASAPSTVALSVARGRSAGSGTATVNTGSLASVGRGSSTGSAVVAFTGSLSLSGTGVLAPSGGTSTAVDKFGTVAFSGTGTLALSGSAVSGPPGAGSVTVIPEPGNSPPRMQLDLAGFLGTTVTIVRIDSAGNRAPVRLANPGSLSSGSWVGYDYEAPFNEPVRYEATATRVVLSDPVTLVVSQPWLIHPGVPSLSMPIELIAPPTRTRDVNAGVHNILGRSTPIVITDGARRAPTFDLQVNTHTLADELKLDALLGDASTLLLQLTYSNTTRTDYWWVAVGQITTTPLVPVYESPYMQWTLPCTVTDPPSGLLQSERTWADLLAEEPTWADVIADYATWRDVITNNQNGA